MNVCTTIDYHTAGEPFRIVAEPPVPLPGVTVAEKRANAITDDESDGLRRLLCFEPRGHADMYGGFITEPDDDGADFGVLFWHKDGFSTACGHGTMALGAWAVSSGLVTLDPSGITEVTIDVPSGRVRAQVHTDDEGRATSVDFVNVPSRLVGTGITVPTSRGPVSVALAWGGALYAVVDGTQLSAAPAGGSKTDKAEAEGAGGSSDGSASCGGGVVRPENLTELIGLGREIKAGLVDHPLTVHPDDERLSGVYGTIIVDRLGTLPTGELHQRNVTVFADGQVDRSPCGSGTAARVAALHATGELAPGQTLVHDSIVGTRFHARVLEEVSSAGDGAAGDRSGLDSVIPVVTGTAHKVAACTFEIDPLDDLVPGFVLR
ncbi:proline racemase family protein [Brevibacterium oceani]|uniref:proline racemase family protein n=1 Tax=Brevibacterium oceani TaxID=358099 RepID=UPI001B31B7D2|nr:proline racemase family protein [Brevibacterium oceani]